MSIHQIVTVGMNIALRNLAWGTFGGLTMRTCHKVRTKFGSLGTRCGLGVRTEHYVSTISLSRFFGDLKTFRRVVKHRGAALAMG